MWLVFECKRTLAYVLAEHSQYAAWPGESERLLEEDKIYYAEKETSSLKGPWCECEGDSGRSPTHPQGAMRRKSISNSCAVDLGVIPINVSTDTFAGEDDWENISDETFTARLRSLVNEVVLVLQDELRVLQPDDPTPIIDPMIRYIIEEDTPLVPRKA